MAASETTPWVQHYIVYDQELLPPDIVPSSAYNSIGVDLPFAIKEPLTLQPGLVYQIPLGIYSMSATVKGDHEATDYLVMPRSGTSLLEKRPVPMNGIAHANVSRIKIFERSSLSLENTVGFIDRDYRGEWMARVICNDSRGYTVQPGEKLLQAVSLKSVKPVLISMEDFRQTPHWDSWETARAHAGFNSTGR